MEPIKLHCSKTFLRTQPLVSMLLKNLCHKPEAGLLNIRHMLSLSFRCDQIYKNEIYNFGHTLLCYLSQTLMFNEPDSDQELIS
jgi:hypothetical protein